MLIYRYIYHYIDILHYQIVEAHRRPYIERLCAEYKHTTKAVNALKRAVKWLCVGMVVNYPHTKDTKNRPRKAKI